MSVKRMLSIAGVSSILLLGGCADKDEPIENDEATIGLEDEEKGEGSTINEADGYGFTTFDLKIKKDDKKIETQYEDVKPDDAEYVNEFQEVDKEDTEALDSMHKMFLEIMIDDTTTEEEAIDSILQWYGLDDYDEFKLDVEFANDKSLHVDESK